MRGLRYVFDEKPAFISKIPNTKIIEKANDLLQTDNIKKHPMDDITYQILSRINFKPEEYEHITPTSILLKKKNDPPWT